MQQQNDLIPRALDIATAMKAMWKPGNGLPFVGEAAEVIEALVEEVGKLRKLTRIEIDLSNHHNAALCPYCSGDPGEAK